PYTACVLDEFATEEETQWRRDRRPRRTGRKLLVGFLVLLLAGVALVGGFGVYLGSIVARNVSTERDMLPSSQPTREDGTAYEIPETGTGMNILFTGADTRPGDVGRSDVIVLAHITEDRSTVYLTHFPRDLYVAIPGHGKNKINASYAWGGTSLLVE